MKGPEPPTVEPDENCRVLCTTTLEVGGGWTFKKNVHIPQHHFGGILCAFLCTHVPTPPILHPTSASSPRERYLVASQSHNFTQTVFL